MQELIAKGVIEGLETDEEEEEVVNGGILEVAEICNQNHFSGMFNLNVIASEWVIVPLPSYGRKKQ